MKTFGTIMAWILGFVLVIVLIMALMTVTTGLSVFGLHLGKYVQNAQTGVTRSTNQFVTSNQQQLASLARNYAGAVNDGDTAQAKLIAEQMDQIATTLDSQYITKSVATILVNAGYNDPKYMEAMNR